jgi:hypothetical protein
MDLEKRLRLNFNASNGNGACTSHIIPPQKVSLDSNCSNDSHLIQHPQNGGQSYQLQLEYSYHPGSCNMVAHNIYGSTASTLQCSS